MKKLISDTKTIRALALILSLTIFLSGCGISDLYKKIGKKDDQKTESEENTGDESLTDEDDDASYDSGHYIPTDAEIEKDPSAAFKKYTDSIFLDDIKENTLNMHYILAYPEKLGIEDYEVGFGDPSLDDFEEYKKERNEMEKQLARFNRDELSEEYQIAYDIMIDSIGQEKMIDDCRYLSEPLSASNGQQQVLPTILAEYTFRREKDVEDYLVLLTKVDELFDYYIEYENVKVDQGLFMSDHTLDRAIDQCEQFIEDPENCFMIDAFDERIDKADFLSDEQKEEYKKKNKELILSEVIPAYEKLIDDLDGFHGKGKEQTGICGYPGGKKYYEFLVEANVGTDASIDELEDRIGDYIVDRIGRIRDLVDEHPDLYDKYVNFSFGKTDPTQIMDELIEKSKADFPEPPDVDYEIKSVDPSMEEHTSPAFYLTPPIDDNKKNVIYINHSSTSPDELYYTLAHEGYPGHLYESVFASNYDRPLIREMYSWGGYTEGWATYTEFYSFGYGIDDKNLANVMMWDRATTLAIYAYVDIQVNYNGWDVEDVSSYMSRFYGEGASAGATEMYDYMTEDPATYLNYFVGYLEFVNLRNKAKSALGDEFTMKDFHQFIMDQGPMPFYMLDERLDIWVKNR